MEQDPTRKRLIKTALIVFATISIMMVLIFLITGGRDQPTNEVEKIDAILDDSPFNYTISSNIVGVDKLESKIVSLDTDTYIVMEALRTDLHTFGRAAYDAYKNDTTKPIGFKITSDVKNDKNVVSFYGHYGSSQNKVTVRLELLNNARMKVSILDTETNFAVDDKLPSNSKINQFIASLPISGEEYNITYVSGKTVNIGLYFRDPSLRDRAQQDIINRLGVEETKKLDISVTFPSEGF